MLSGAKLTSVRYRDVETVTTDVAAIKFEIPTLPTLNNSTTTVPK